MFELLRTVFKLAVTNLTQNKLIFPPVFPAKNGKKKLCKKMGKLLITLSFPQFPQVFPQPKKPQKLRLLGLHNLFRQGSTFFDFFKKFTGEVPKCP